MKLNPRVAVAGPDEPAMPRALNCSMRWTRRGIEYESHHKLADELIEELGLSKNRAVVTLAIRDSRKARKKQGENQTRDGAGGWADPQASIGQAGLARGKAHRKENDTRKAGAGRRGGNVSATPRAAERVKRIWRADFCRGGHRVQGHGRQM